MEGAVTDTRVRFEPCCKESLQSLKHNIKIGKKCDSAIVIGQFVTLFSSNIIQFSINLTMNDWDLFAKNIGKCSIIAKERSIKHL